MAGKVVHFEIPVDDGDRACAFYGQVFGWELSRFGDFPYWTTEAGEGEGIGGALAGRDPDSAGLMFYIAVDDIAAALDAIGAAGGSALTEPVPIPGVGWSAHFADSEGNRVGVFQDDPSVPVPGAPAD